MVKPAQTERQARVVAEVSEGVSSLVCRLRLRVILEPRGQRIVFSLLGDLQPYREQESRETREIKRTSKS